MFTALNFSKNKYILIYALLFCFNSNNLLAQDSLKAKINNLQNIVNQGLQYLQTTQYQTTQNNRFKGEWLSTMGLRTRFLMLGKKINYEDANCFTVATIHNALAELYLLDNTCKLEPQVLANAYNAILKYKNGNGFNFWNALPPNRDLKLLDAPPILRPLVRRPTNYKLKNRFMNNAANIANDADDTGLACIAFALQQKIAKSKNSKLQDTLGFNNCINEFNKYQDVNRKNWHWYNYINKKEHNTGAFLTWLSPEYEFKNWNVAKGLLHNTFFYAKWSACFPHAYKAYIPYGANDLDAVVNANVLTSLAVTNNKNISGYNKALAYVQKKCLQKKYTRVGIYYPNNYTFPYVVSKAYASGVTELQKSSKIVIQNLLASQQKNGSWLSRKIVNNTDALQSTIYAVNALLNFGDYTNNKTTQSIHNAMQYILQNAITDAQGIHWQGGVFFSGGTVVRNTLFWKSDAYTTTLAILAISKYQKLLIKKN